MKRALDAPQAAAPTAARLWDLLALGAALVMAVAVLGLPWLEGGDGPYRALELLRGLGDRRADHALIFLPFFALAAGLLAALGALLSPPDARHWRVFYRWAGGAALLYFFNYYVNKDHNLATLGDVERAGFSLFFAGGLALTVLGLMPRPPAAASATPTRLDGIMQSDRFWGALYVLPMLALTLAFTVYPVLESLRISTYNWRGIGEATQFVGLRHYRTVMSDPYFWNAFWNTAQYTAILVPVQLTLALLLAVVLDNPKLRLRTLYRTLFFMPVVTTLAIVAIVVRLLFQSLGAANPVANADTAILAVTGFGIWYSFGVNLVYFMAALQTVPSELYDAAAVDGANWLQRVWNISLPSIRPLFVVILFFAVLGSLKVWEQSFVLTGGGPFFSSEVVNGYIYRYAFGSGGLGASGTQPNIGFASAAGFLMSMLVLLVTLVQLGVTRLMNRGK